LRILSEIKGEKFMGKQESTIYPGEKPVPAIPALQNILTRRKTIQEKGTPFFSTLPKKKVKNKEGS